MKTKTEMFKPTLIMTMFSLLNYAIIFVLQIVTANYYGNGIERDSFLIALTVPMYVLAVVSVVPSVFLPIFIDVKSQSSEAAWKFASTSIFLSMAILTIVALIGSVSAPVLVHWISPTLNTNSIEMSVLILRIAFPAVLFSFLSSVLSAVYYAQQHFILPAIAPVFSTFTYLFFAILGSDRFGIYSLAFGYFAGSIASFLVVSPALKNMRFPFSLKDSNLGVLFKSATPLILAGVVFQLTSVFQKRIASILPPGNISSFGYALQLVTVLSTLLSGAIISLLFPMMSSAWSEGRLDEVRSYLLRGMVAILMATVPFIGIFYFWSEPLISLVFERGAFTHADSLLVSDTVFHLSMYMVFVSLGGLITKGYYFSQKTKVVAIQEVVVLVVYLWLGFLFAERWSLRGLAVASSIASGLSFLSSCVIVGRIVEGLDNRKIIISFLQIFTATFVAVGSTYYVQRMMVALNGGVAWLIGCIFFSLVVYFISLRYVFRLPEAVYVWQSFAGWIDKAWRSRFPKNLGRIS